jgi:hypothetical protein
LTGAAAAAVTVAYANATYALYDLLDPGAVLERETVSGSATSFKLALVDQFGGVLASASYRAVVTVSGRTTSSVPYLLTNGAVDVQVVDNAVSGTTNTVAVDIQKLQTDGTWGDDDLTATGGQVEEWTGGSARVINYKAAPVAAVQLNATGTNTFGGTNALFVGALTTTDLASVDNRLTTDDETATSAINISGRVAASQTSVGLGSQLVTVTGPSNVVFNVGDVYGAGSLSFYATATTGVFDIKAVSNIAQKDTVITVTSAGVSNTVKITFSPAAARSGKTLTITSANAEPGKTMVITGKLVDKYGNAVDTEQDATTAAGAATLDAGDARFSVTYTGPGFTVGTLPVETDANGEFAVRVLLGSNDSGSATVTATYGAANGVIAAADTGVNKDITTAATITIGAAPAAKVAAFTKRAGDKIQIVSQGSAKVAFFLNGKRVASRQSLGTLNRTFDLVDGKNVIEIYVDGKRQLRRAATK